VVVGTVICEHSICAEFVLENWPTGEKFRGYVNQVGNRVRNMMTDPISDMLARIRNAFSVKKTEVYIPHSKMKYSLAKILEKEGYVGRVESMTRAKFPEIRIELAYRNERSAISTIKRVSKPGMRIYKGATELPHVLSGIGMAVISTPNGLMTNKEARARRLGGEVICEIT
jgi:small subunit ribosomal protein S8